MENDKSEGKKNDYLSDHGDSTWGVNDDHKEYREGRGNWFAETNGRFTCPLSTILLSFFLPSLNIRHLI